MANTNIRLNQIQQSGASTNDVIKWNGSAWTPSAITGDGNGIFSGSGTVPTATVATITDSLTFSETSLTNSAVLTPIIIDAKVTSGVGAANFGTGLLFTAESNSQTDREIFGIEASWSNASDASRTSSIAFKLPSSGTYDTRLTLTPGALTQSAAFTFGNHTTDTTIGGSSGRAVLSSSANAADAILLNVTGTTNSSGITMLGSNTYTNSSGSKVGVTINGSFTPTTGTATFTSQAITTTINQSTGGTGTTRGLHIDQTLTWATNHRGLEITGSFAPTLGSTIYTAQLINPTINQTGSASGITRGIHINPTLTAFADFRAIDIANTAANSYGIYQSGLSVINLLAGNTAIGSTLPGSYKLRVTGTARFDLGSDATGDLFYRNSNGDFTRLPIGANTHVLTSNGTIPTWSAPSGGGNGIYGGSGTIASAAVATVTSSSTFTIDYNGGVDALVIDDSNGNVSINAKAANSGTLQVNDIGVALGGATTDGLVFVDEATFALTAADSYTPATSQNNYAIADGTSRVRINASADIEITGISQTTSTSGRILVIHNVSPTYKLTLKNESASSTGANRISLGANELSDVVLRPHQSFTLIYDGTSSRWRAWTSPVIPTGVELTSALPTNTTAHGITTTFTANENQGFGDVVFINVDGEAQLADADFATTMPAVAMCLGSVTANNVGNYLLYGIARNDTWNWTVGGYVYVSTTGTTTNTLTQTAPSGTGDIVQIVGIATHADRILFKPDLTTIEI